MENKIKTAYIVLSDEPPKAFKNLKSLCENTPTIKYFYQFRKFKIFNTVILDNLTIYKATIQ